jgi:phosphoglucosamine mutase
MTRRFFGTDGIRGPVGGPLINPEFAARLGAAAGKWSGGGGMAVIGRDTRASGVAIEAAVARGLTSVGMKVVSLGVLPTPAIARAVRDRTAALGVVITASHNPASDNGVKFFGPGGTKLDDAAEAAIEARLPAGPAPVADVSMERDEAALHRYIDTMVDVLPPHALAGWRIVLDAANGATAVSSPAVLRRLGAEVELLGASPDGVNINDGVGSEHPEALAARVQAWRGRIGIAHDGDGDRCVVCDELGGVLDGDEVLTVLGLHALRTGRLVNRELVITVQSNLGVDEALRSAGGTVFRTAVGDRYVLERMRASGASLGGESSGHVVCADLAMTGDGLATALRMLAVMRDTGAPLSELRKQLRRFPQVTRSMIVRERRPLEACLRLANEMAALERELAGAGRVLVRYSGTEPKLRLLVEARDEVSARHGVDRLEAAARTDLSLPSGSE